MTNKLLLIILILFIFYKIFIINFVIICFYKQLNLSYLKKKKHTGMSALILVIIPFPTFNKFVSSVGSILKDI